MRTIPEIISVLTRSHADLSIRIRDAYKDLKMEPQDFIEVDDVFSELSSALSDLRCHATAMPVIPGPYGKLQEAMKEVGA